MNTSTAPRARRVAQLSPSASTLRLRLSRWALANGHRLGFDALTVILAAKTEDAQPVTRWTEDDIWRLWWVDLSGWCASRGMRAPDGLASTMMALLAFLDQTGGFTSDSDPLSTLHEAMEGSGALWRGPTSAPAS